MLDLNDRTLRPQTPLSSKASSIATMHSYASHLVTFPLVSCLYYCNVCTTHGTVQSLMNFRSAVALEERKPYY